MTSTEREDPNILRAHLQRTEVHLSTLHRIGGAFLSGAGLLFLLPGFFCDQLVEIVIGAALILLKAPPHPHSWLLVIYLAPMLPALFLPIYAIWLLVHDLVIFYFTANLGFNDIRDQRSNTFQPRFALSALDFPRELSPDTQAEIRHLQFDTKIRKLAIPEQRKELDKLRGLAKHLASERAPIFLDDKNIRTSIAQDDEQILRLAFGITGSYNRTLPEEVAIIGLVQVRTVFLLRRLVLRYVKALLLLLWTIIIAFIVVCLIRLQQGADNGDLTFDAGAIGVFFIIWAALSPAVVRRPIVWIYREFDAAADDKVRDYHMVRFESTVCWISYLSAAGGFIAGLMVSLTGVIPMHWWWLLIPVFPMIVGGIAFARHLGWAENWRLVF